MIKRISVTTATIGVGVLLAATAAVAGEIKGPPPTGNYENTPGSISNGNSRCSFSGLNDTPDGLVIGGDVIDPGGQVQSFGYFMAQRGAPYDPSDPASRAGFAFPGEGCNPQRTGGTH